jgi:hypothetical protein
MKKIVLAVLVMGLLVTGLWWTIRRKPGTVPPTEDNGSAFKVETSASGMVIRYDNPQMPLRALRWMPPLPNGLLLVQVATQSDRQEITLFKNGALQGTFLVPKPAGVRDGFFRLAELQDAQVVEGDVAVLLYAVAGAGDDEPPLVIALDLNTKDIRWIHRAPGEHLAMSEIQDGVIYLYGAKTSPVKLPLALANGETTSPTGARSSARSIELPADVQEISDLKPTGAWTFLLAHKGGLSAYLGSKGWQHHPMPDGRPDYFKDAPGVLAVSAKKYWWQPYPGAIAQVSADGTPKSFWSPEELATAAPFEKDASLLHLLGADADGKLWFDLAIPNATASPEASTGSSWKPETPAASSAEPQTAPSAEEATSTKLEDWPGYVSQGLDRVYNWDPQKKSLQRAKWTALTTPQGFQRPSNGVRFRPLTGALLQDNGPTAWLVPLSSLVFGESSATGKPAQLK